MKRKCTQRHDLHPQANHQCAVQPRARTDPTTQQIRKNAHELVGEEQEGDGDRRIAKLMEMQQYQHAKRTIGECERPVPRRDQGVVADLHGSEPWLSDAATFAANSAILHA